MKNLTHLIELVVVGLIAGAISYWFNPCNKEHFLGIQVQLLLVITTFLGALISKIFFKTKAWLAAILISFGVMTSVISRISFDIINCPTAHNLLPLEILLDLFLVILSAFAGSYLTALPNYLKLK
jgi:hypothetical protein